MKDEILFNLVIVSVSGWGLGSFGNCNTLNFVEPNTIKITVPIGKFPRGNYCEGCEKSEKCGIV